MGTVQARKRLQRERAGLCAMSREIGLTKRRLVRCEIMVLYGSSACDAVLVREGLPVIFVAHPSAVQLYDGDRGKWGAK
jgi:hypothetical protein